MKISLRSILSFLLAVSILICATVPAFAAGTGEEYICDLRLIYANDYKEAKAIIADGDFEGYRVLNENLNDNPDKTGVWLAYKTTTDIEDAITDISVIQMCGGYKEGNYQQMIQESYSEYVAMGATYLQAINYFIKAYKAGHFLSESAYRQLNFYNVVSEGIPKEEIPKFEGKRLGDIFYDGIDKYALATMFFEGNSYALQNIRSLIAMGVSYNEDGKSYLDKVGDAAAKMEADPTVFDGGEYDELAALIDPTITVIRNMLKELSAYESELNYLDDELTDDELKYAENKAVADMLRNVKYLNGKTLYQFCLEYKTNDDDYSSLYPLAYALNEGQIAMTKVAHYYDVVRYSISEYPEEFITSEIDKQEKIYKENPFNIYTGVDRTIYDGTFALTNDAYRADVYGEGGISDALFGGDRAEDTTLNIVTGTIGVGIFIGAIVRRSSENAAIAPAAIEAAKKATETLQNSITAITDQNISALGYAIHIPLASGRDLVVNTYGDLINSLLVEYNVLSQKALASYSMFDKYQMLMAKSASFPEQSVQWGAIKKLNAHIKTQSGGEFKSYDAYQATVDAGTASHFFSNILFVVGGVLMLYSAYNLVMTVYNYYHPEYEDIPLAMVDMINTVDGDRYIKYDAVFTAETNEDGVYEAADLNAFEGLRWNALYYTKSYEAGKPLLADEFSVSTRNNKPKDNYAPVHRFGELVCYDLNKYSVENNSSIYLSIKQSKNNKAAVTDVPEVVGSMFSTGVLFLAGGIGAVFGAGGVLATMEIVKKKRTKTDKSDTVTKDSSDI